MKQIKINNLLWDTKDLIIGRRTYFTYEQAIKGAAYRKKRLPTLKELKELFKLGSIWDDTLKGRWVAGNYNTNHMGSLFFPALGISNVYTGVIYKSRMGCIWSSSLYTEECISLSGLYFDFNGVMNPQIDANHAYSYLVRCVSDL